MAEKPNINIQTSSHWT